MFIVIRSILSAAILFDFFQIGLAVAQTEREARLRYESRYFLSGLLVRAAMVCRNDAEQTIEVAFNIVAADEYKSFSEAFPQMTKGWMGNGADALNSDVMKNGMQHACALAADAKRRAIAIVEDDLKNGHLTEKEMAAPAQPKAPSKASIKGADLVKKCQKLRLSEPHWTAADKTFYREKCWEKVESDTGAVFQVDLGLIQDFGAEATSVVYKKEGKDFDPMNLQRWFFSCKGHFSIMQQRGRSEMVYAPPRSVAGRISKIVCDGAGMKQQ